jgi:hypothetical protein
MAASAASLGDRLTTVVVSEPRLSMLQPTRRRRPGPVVLVGLVAGAWCLATLLFVIVHDSVSGLSFAGPYAGLFPNDQLRYLAWIREAGQHPLIADPFRAGAPHAYLQPVFAISGLLWRAGLSAQAAYLIWTPVALGALVWGYSRFTARFLIGRQQAAALALGLLFFSPLIPLFDWGGVVDANGANSLAITAGHVAAYWQAWGYLPTVIALGVTPLFLRGVESLVTRRDQPRRALIWVALAGLVVAWLDPWTGIELVLIVLALLLSRRDPPSVRRLAVLAAVAAVPLVYYVILAQIDPAWSLTSIRAVGTSPMWWPLLVSALPLLLPALPALRRPKDAGEQILLLWPAAALAVYCGLGSGSRGAALEGVSLSLAVLAVRGWSRLQPSRLITYTVLFLAIVPGALYSAATFHDIFRSKEVPFGLARGEQRAIASLGPGRGNVLATTYLASTLPSRTGLIDGQVITGSDAFFDGVGGIPAALSVIRERQVKVVVSDCLRGRVDLTRALAPLGFEARRYGCASVYARLTPTG